MMKNNPNICYVKGPHNKISGLPDSLMNYSPLTNKMEKKEKVDKVKLQEYNNIFKEGIKTKSTNEILASNHVVIDNLEKNYLLLLYTNKNAGNLNSFGYFAYPTYNPPIKISDIDTLYILFSKIGSSPNSNPTEENIKRGQFVYIPSNVDIKNGTIESFKHKAGTSIGFFLVSDGWNQATSTVNIKPDYSNVFFSLMHLNPEIDLAKKTHFLFFDNIQLYNSLKNTVNIACEDVNNETHEYKDMDYNDLLFTIKRIKA